MTEEEAKQLNPLTLAFLGDAAYTLHVREKLVKSHDLRSGGLHVLAAAYVRASAQAAAYDGIKAALGDDEAAVGRRARNAHTVSHPKNAEIADYRKATALEAIFGYLRLIGAEERLDELMNTSMAIVDEKKEKK